MLLSNRWLFIPNMACVLLYFAIVEGGVFAPTWGFHPALGFFIASGISIALAMGMASLVPPFIGGIFVVGVREKALGIALEASMTEFDASALELRLQEIEISRWDRKTSSMNRLLMATILAFTLTAIVGWRMGYDLFNLYTD